MPPPGPASGRSSRSVIARAAAGVAAMLCAGLLAGCGGVLDPKGPIGDANRTILIGSVAIMLAIVIPTILATFGFAWWYRASNKKATYLPDWEFSGKIEMVVWAIPLMVILLLGGVTWIGSHMLDPAKPIVAKDGGPPLAIQVVSLDWKWLFIYPEQRVASVNELVVPAGRPLHFTLTSSSVMNAFFIPQLGSMIYTMNGMATQLYLHADEPGTFHGMSAHFSGEGFSDMNFPVHAVSAEAFASWVNKTREGKERLDGEAYDRLTKPTVRAPKSTYAVVDIDLFDRIVRSDLAPGPGPELERNDAAQAPREHH